ncbi:MAG: hypothetical protein IJ749_07255 [Eubacterium sp.]|nr:hypothetical protein [Eubacterium sp.]
MGDNKEKEEKKSALEMIDSSINQVNDRIYELQYRLDKETNPEEITRLKNEIGNATQQLNYVKGVKLEYEDQINQAEDDERKKKIESIVKMALFAGIIFENNRIKAERDRVIDKDREIVHQAQLDVAVKKIFGTNEFRFVTEDMVEDILLNEEFQDMAEHDPNRLMREEQAVKDKYTRTMSRTLSLAGINGDMSFDEMEEKFRKLMEKKGAYEVVVEKIRTQMEPLLRDAGDEVDKKFFNEFIKEALELNLELKEVEREFALGTSDFKKGNGYTRELIAKEEALYNKFNEYMNGHAMVRAMETADNTDDKSKKVHQIYARCLEFVNPLKAQLRRDKDLMENNELRTKMEMWQVYEKLPKGTAPTIKKIKAAADDEYKMWAKVDRIVRSGLEIGGIYDETAGYAASQIQKVNNLVRTKKQNNTIKNFTDAEKQTVKEQLAALVLHQIIADESSAPLNADKSHYKKFVSARLNALGRRDLFFSTARDFAKSKEFETVYNKYMKGGRFDSKIVRFMSEDMEKKMAKEIKALELKNSAKKDLDKKPPELKPNK